MRLVDRKALEQEADLVEACRGGDRAALQQVFSEHAPFLERLLTRVAGPGDEVEDLLQMTLMAAMKAFPGFRGEARVRTWLSRIAIRVAQEHLRKPERTRRARLTVVEDARTEDESRAPDRNLETRRMMERLYHHLDAIGPKKRVAFVLHVFEGHSVEQVAALVGASLTATKSRVFWARKELIARASKDPVLRGVFRGEL